MDAQRELRLESYDLLGSLYSGRVRRAEYDIQESLLSVPVPHLVKVMSDLRNLVGLTNSWAWM